MKKYIFVFLLLLGLALPLGASGFDCRAINLLPASRTIADESTVLSWQINCKMPEYGYFVFIDEVGNDDYPWFFYAPTSSFALGPYMNILFGEGPTKYNWYVETCLNFNCSIRSDQSEIKSFYQPSHRI